MTDSKTFKPRATLGFGLLKTGDPEPASIRRIPREELETLKRKAEPKAEQRIETVDQRLMRFWNELGKALTIEDRTS